MKLISKVSIGLLIVGFILVIVGFVSNGAEQIREIYANGDTLFSITFGNRKGGTETISMEYEGIRNLDFEVDAYSIVITEYEGDTIIVEGDIRNTIVIEQIGDTLKIKEEDSFYFGILDNIFHDNSDLTMYVPKNIEFNNIELDVNTGSIDVETILKANKASFDVDVGSITTRQLVCSNGKFDVDVGSIDIELLDSQSIECNVDVGSFSAYLVGEEKEYSYTVECDLGDVTIGSYSASGISTKDKGGNGTRHIKAECDVGDINMEMRGEQ